MASSHSAYFFPATKSVSDELGHMFSFTWAGYLGLRELWWQVRGYKNTYPSLSAKQIENKFIGGLSLPGGIDFKQIMLDMTWEEHEQKFAKSILFEACTMYECWLEAVCGNIMPTPKLAKNCADQLQFPLGHLSGSSNKPWDYSIALSVVNSNASPFMRSQFFKRLKLNGLNCWNNFDDYVTAYRYFKECRNSYIHSSGKVNSRVVEQHALLAQLQCCPKIPFRHVFNHPFSLNAPVEGQKITLNLNDCKLFATIVQRMIITLDAALSVHVSCEEIFGKISSDYVSKNRAKWKNLSANTLKRHPRVKGLLLGAGLPLAMDIGIVDNWLTGRGVI